MRKGIPKSKGRLRNLDGRVVQSDEQAETLAQYFETVQWRVRPVRVIDDDAEVKAKIGADLPMNLQPTTMVELRRAALKSKSNRGCGIDDVPGGFWRAILEDPGHPASRWILCFCFRSVGKR